ADYGHAERFVLEVIEATDRIWREQPPGPARAGDRAYRASQPDFISFIQLRGAPRRFDEECRLSNTCDRLAEFDLDRARSKPVGEIAPGQWSCSHDSREPAGDIHQFDGATIAPRALADTDVRGSKIVAAEYAVLIPIRRLDTAKNTH